MTSIFLSIHTTHSLQSLVVALLSLFKLPSSSLRKTDAVRSLVTAPELFIATGTDVVEEDSPLLSSRLVAAVAPLIWVVRFLYT